MSTFNDVFNPQVIYDSLFLSVKSVLEYPTLDDLKTNNPLLFERWDYISKQKNEFMQNSYFSNGISNDDFDNKNYYYNKVAVYYPEFCKIVAVCFGQVTFSEGKLVRHLKKISNDNELFVIAGLIDELENIAHGDENKIPVLCGHNIINHDIPLIIKRFLKHRKSLNEKKIPMILKRVLNLKPWESGIIDTINVWKFNGSDISPLLLIADFLGLKRNHDLLSKTELSNYYWSNIQKSPQETLKFVELQSANTVNLVIQLINELRYL